MVPFRYVNSTFQVHFLAFSQEQLNPNLYQTGKVCTSLLGTWAGEVRDIKLKFYYDDLIVHFRESKRGTRKSQIFYKLFCPFKVNSTTSFNWYQVYLCMFLFRSDSGSWALLQRSWIWVSKGFAGDGDALEAVQRDSCHQRARVPVANRVCL